MRRAKSFPVVRWVLLRPWVLALLGSPPAPAGRWLRLLPSVLPARLVPGSPLALAVLPARLVPGNPLAPVGLPAPQARLVPSDQ